MHLRAVHLLGGSKAMEMLSEQVATSYDLTLPVMTSSEIRYRCATPD